MLAKAWFGYLPEQKMHFRWTGEYWRPVDFTELLNQ